MKYKISDKFFKDKNNDVVIWQKPNLPIVVWFLCLIGSKYTDGTVNQFLSIVGFGAIFAWSWMEIFQGVNYFRRLLGIIVIFVSLYSRLH